MSDIFFKVFKKSADHENWAKHIEYATLLVSISNVTRQDFIEALQFLSKELGKGFLKQAKDYHPLKRWIENTAEWQIVRIIEFSKHLRCLKSRDTNYVKVLDKLRSGKGATMEGLPFVEIAGSYLSQGFEVKFLDEGNSKTPDIEIINPINQDKFYIEVSTVESSDLRRLLEDNYQFLSHQFRYGVPFHLYTGRQKAAIERDDYTRVAKVIMDLKQKVEETLSVISYSDDSLEFSLAPFEKEPELIRICEKKKTRKNDFIGMPINFDVTDRLIKNKIKPKAAQIPASCNGVIYFPVDAMFFLTIDLNSSIQRLTKCMSKFKHILGVVLYSYVIDPKEGSCDEFDGHIRSASLCAGVLSKEVLFVRNHSCTLEISNETLQEIYATLK